eukprot:UN24789
MWSTMNNNQKPKSSPLTGKSILSDFGNTSATSPPSNQRPYSADHTLSRSPEAVPEIKFIARTIHDKVSSDAITQYKSLKRKILMQLKLFASFKLFHMWLKL